MFFNLPPTPFPTETKETAPPEKQFFDLIIVIIVLFVILLPLIIFNITYFTFHWLNNRNKETHKCHCDATCMEGWRPLKYNQNPFLAQLDQDELVFSRGDAERFMHMVYRAEVDRLEKWRAEKKCRARRMEEGGTRRSGRSYIPSLGVF